MTHYFKIVLMFAIVVFAHANSFANSAQPGFWDAGGTGSFSLLYPEDSAAYKKVQMVNELVAIQLYPGYAVVKGTYWMHNTTNDSLSFKAGYPMYGHYTAETEHYSLMDISFDSLYSLKVRLDGDDVLEYGKEYRGANRWEANNWYVFQVHFAPMDTVMIEVYFILNTNNTTISQGYDRDNTNGFIYLLETGATWKQPILQGEVRIQTMGGLSIDDIVGIAPDSVMQLDGATQTIVYIFNNLSPNHDSNVVIAYGEQIEDFDFAGVVSRSGELYEAVEALALQKPSVSLKPIEFDNPFVVHSFSGGLIYGLFMAGAIFGPFILAVVVLLIVIWLTIRYIRKKKKR